MLRFAPPAYPAQVKEKNLRDDIESEITINIYGRVTDMYVINGTHEMLIKAALHSVKQWVLEPYIMNGAPRLIYALAVIGFSDEPGTSPTAAYYRQASKIEKHRFAPTNYSRVIFEVYCGCLFRNA
ncbi:MAG: hypothetical protein GY757_17920 [bacterium]|nr:hypothetical protein [bacterium]